MKGFLVYIVFFLSIIFGNAQGLSATDSLYLQNLKSILVLTDTQMDSIESIYALSQIEINKTEKEIRTISRSDLADSLKSERTTALTAEKKKMKELRELDILLVLTEDQKKRYAEKIKIPNPGVAHFGINHDRASCVVCLPK
jgi:hypothetical protein